MSLDQLIFNLPELIGKTIESNQLIGYLILVIAMFLENLIPPIPSEVIMPLGGFYVQQGQLGFVPVVLSGLLGTVLGALPWYGLGRLVNEEKIERWLQRNGRFLGISSNDLLRSRKWFNRYGTALVFWGRLIPGIRTLISLPAGIELMPLIPFLAWTTAGSLLWTLLLTLSGLFLGESYANVEVWIEPFSNTIKVVLLLSSIGIFTWLCIRLVRFRKDGN